MGRIMRSGVEDIMPVKVRRSMAKLGKDINVARRKRRLTVAMMMERTGIAKSTYLRVERGCPKVALGTYAMCLFALGVSDAFGNLIDVKNDDTGLLLEQERLPKRIHKRKTEEVAV